MYLLTIGLEIHLKLNSQNKIFCSCKNEQNFSIEANTHICPVCTWQPGALPRLSHEVVQKAIRFGNALRATVNDQSQFDRKNYFYPDLPMGFQITQFYHPIITNGEINFWSNNYEKEVKVWITEAHLECDTAKMIHEEGKSYLDFNRAGTPLLEIVTAPDFHTAEEVVEFAKELQRIAKWNNLGDADLEKGQMRIDVNISVRKNESDPLGTKVEMKNINTFSAIKRCIEHESQRQEEILENGWEIAQETRRWNDLEGNSFSMRSKEDADDYRYFPEPDMSILKLDPQEKAEIMQESLDRPFDYIHKCKEYGFNKEFINALLLDKQIFDFFFVMVQEGFEPKTVAKWMVGPMKRCLDYFQGDEIEVLKNISEEARKTWANAEELIEKKLKFVKTCEGLADFFEKVRTKFEAFLQKEKEKSLIDNQLKLIFGEMLESGDSLEKIIKAKGFDAPAIDSSELETLAQQVLDENPKIVEQFKGGKESVIGFFVGQLMKKTQWKANPQEANQIFMKLLK